MQSLPRKPKNTHMNLNYMCWNRVCHHPCWMFSHFSSGNVERCKVSAIINRAKKSIDGILMIFLLRMPPCS
jgi:nickel-dependent lactate racemase